jgi:deoxyribose-phosphate aldolase
MNLNQAIEHTILSASAQPADIERLCREAREFGFHGVCVNPLYVPRAAALLRGSAVRLVSVVNFPLGAGSENADRAECERMLEQGAQEVDWVIPIGLALAGDDQEVLRRAKALRDCSQGATLKLIFECGHFAPSRLEALATRLMEAEPDFLKTATGFGPRGATVEDIRIFSRVAAGRAGVKASGGVRSRSDALVMLDAGATRIGTSSGVQIVSAP